MTVTLKIEGKEYEFDNVEDLQKYEDHEPVKHKQEKVIVKVPEEELRYVKGAKRFPKKTDAWFIQHVKNLRAEGLGGSVINERLQEKGIKSTYHKVRMTLMDLEGSDYPSIKKRPKYIKGQNSGMISRSGIGERREMVIKHMKALGRPRSLQQLAEGLGEHLAATTPRGQQGEIVRLLKPTKAKSKKVAGTIHYYLWGQRSKLPSASDVKKGRSMYMKPKSPYRKFMSDKIKYYTKKEGMTSIDALKAGAADWSRTKIAKTIRKNAPKRETPTEDKSWVKEEPTFPLLQGIDGRGSLQVIKEIFRYAIANKNTLRYPEVGHQIGITNGHTWREFCNDVGNKGQQIADYFGTSEAFIKHEKDTQGYDMITVQ